MVRTRITLWGVGLALLACRGAPGPAGAAPLPAAPGPAGTAPLPAGPLVVVVYGFSASGKYVITQAGEQGALVTELATGQRVAHLRLSAPFNILTEANDEEITFESVTDSPDPPVEERFALPDGRQLYRGEPQGWFSTPLGRARLNVQFESDGAVTVAETLVEDPSGRRRRIDLHASFGQDKFVQLESLGSFGDELLVRSHGARGATPIGRVGTINLRTGRVRLVQVLLGASGDIALHRDRLYLLQGPESGAWGYELPSLRLVGRYVFPEAHERHLDELTMGEPPACLAISNDGNTLALAEAGVLRWYDTKSSRKLAEAERLGQIGDFFSCLLRFTPDAQRLARATKYGAVTLLDVTSGKVLYEREYGYCTNCDRRPIASGNMELRGEGELSPDGHYFVGSSPAEPVTYLIDLTTTRVTRFRDGGISFDPTSRYFINGNRIFSSQPLREIAEIPER